MVVPLNRVVTLDVTSPDVAHSWWVPALGGKIDAIPGRVNHTWFEAAEGDYDALCGDLCGIQHTMMLASVHVVPRAGYEQFITARAANAAGADLGKEEYQHVCAVCHRLDTAYVGPALGQNPLLTHAKALATILRQGVGRMPAVGSDWSDDQITALVAYAKTIVKPSDAGSSSGAGGAAKGGGTGTGSTTERTDTNSDDAVNAGGTGSG
jgi:cytochrome c oxidase subunit 2